MKIVNIALIAPFTEGWSYQENLLTKYQARLKHEVYMITTCFMWDSEGNLREVQPGETINSDGVHVIRCRYKHGRNINSTIKSVFGLYEILDKIRPDFIFIHGVQTVDIGTIVQYLKKNKMCKVCVDNHADKSNSARTWVSKNILHKILWKRYAKMINPYVAKWYGVLPARVDFLTDMYNLPRNKCDLLVMGGDDELIVQAKSETIKKSIRNMYSIEEDDFLIITGGKIDLAKAQTIQLMQAVKEIDNKRVKLLVFGSVVSELQEQVDSLCDERVRYIGWIDSKDTYKYFSASDLVVFPGRHSVLWEQAVAQGKPMIVKYWDGTTHIDCGGNVAFIKRDTVEEIKNELEHCIVKENYDQMRKKAEQAYDSFLYSSIAKKSLQF